MRGAAIPLIALLLFAGTIVRAITAPRGEDFTHLFPDASRRPPLRVILADAESHVANDRVQAVRYLGFYRTDAALAASVAALSDPDVLVRLSALRALRLRGDTRALPEVARTAEKDPEEIVKVKAQATLEALSDPLGLGNVLPAFRGGVEHDTMTR